MFNTNELSFKRTMNKIGIAMLIFVGLFNVLFVALSLVFEYINESITSNIIYELIYTLFYLASFIVPGIILNLMMGKDKKPMMMDKKIPIDVAAYIFAAIATVLLVSYVNFLIVNSFGYSEFSSEVIWGNEPLSNYEIILTFITTAIAPAFAEEFLFRGAIFSALKPYGKAPTIFITAIVFAFMHQNIEQLLYTFAAGIVLAWVVYETGSIWCSILIHLFNNFLSVITIPIFDRLPEVTASIVVFLIEFSIFALGIASAIYLLVRKVKNKSKQRTAILDGIYGVSHDELECDDTQTERKIKPGKIVRYFFSPSMIVFLIISIITMILLIIESLLYNAGVA